MKNNFITKIIGATLAFAMMIGGAVGINANKQAKEVSAADGEQFQLVKSTSSLAENDQIVIGSANSGSIYLLSTTQGGNNRTATGPLTVSAEKVTLSAEVQVLTLGLENSHWTFNTGNGYLYAASSSKNYLRTQETNDENGEWTIAITDSGVATVTAQGSNTRNILKFNENNGSPIFSCYSTSGTVAVYKKVVSKELTSISVATAPTKTIYYAGEYFDPTGLVITRNYSDSTSDTYTYAGHAANFTFTPNTSTELTTDDTSITISYGGKTTTQTITVNPARNITAVELLGDMTNKTYVDGDEWDLTGLYLSITWSSGTPNPTTVNLTELTKDTDYLLDSDTASEGDTELQIEGTYEGFDFSKTVTGLTVEAHPQTDVLTGDIIGVQSATYTSSWAEISNVEDYTGAKYMFRTMKPSSGYTMSTNQNGYMVTTYCPAGLKLKSISFSFLTSGKNLGIYASNTAYAAGTAPSATSLGTVSGTGSSVSFNFAALSDEYRYVAFKGTGSSTVIGTITVEYEEIIPEISASPTSIDLAAGLTRTAEITVDKFINTPSLSCNVISGAAYIANASVGAVNNQNKATLTIQASNQSGTAVVRVSASQNQVTYYADVTVNVLESAKSVIENNVNTASSLSFKYTKHPITDTLTAAYINITGSSYIDWSDRAGNTTDAVYAGNSYAGNEDAIQLRADGVSGIVTTTSGGTATYLTVAWNGQTQNGRTIEVYGKNTPYSDASDLSDEDAKGTLIGTIVYGTSTSLQLTGNYAYIGIKSSNASVYFDSIDIEWGGTFDYTNVGMRFGGRIDKALWDDLDTSSTIEGYGVMISTSNSIKTRYNAVETSEGSIDGAFEAVQGQAYKLVKGTDIRAFYNQVSTSPAENGNNYFWNLFQRIDNTSEALNRAYTAVAFIRTADDGIVFLGEITKSVTQLAGEIASTNPSENLVSEGALAYLAGLAN